MAAPGDDTLTIVQRIIGRIKPACGHCIVRIEDGHSVKATFLAQTLDAPFEDIALPGAGRRLLPYGGACRFGDLNGTVPAVVRQHDHFPLGRRICSRQNAAHGKLDHAFFVPCAYQHGKAQRALRRRMYTSLPDQSGKKHERRPEEDDAEQSAQQIKENGERTTAHESPFELQHACHRKDSVPKVIAQNGSTPRGRARPDPPPRRTPRSSFSSRRDRTS